MPRTLLIAESLSLSVSGMSYLQSENVHTNEGN